LEQAVARVTAMGQLHRRMYDAASDGRGFAPLLRDILSEIFKELDVTVAVQADLPTLSLSQMTPIVLLVTEAATNAAKHVFRAGHGSHFAVTLADAASERVCLTIRDDGPGLPQPVAPTSGLGLRIMQGLAAQLGGRVEFESLAGTVVRVEFARAH
jgi:two-component sensor histidine kinase